MSNNNWWKEVDGIKENLQKNKKLEDWIDSGSIPISPAIKNWLRYKEGRQLWETRAQNDDRRITNWIFGTTERICNDCFTKVNIDRRNRNNYWCYTCRQSLDPKNTIERLSSKINISCAYKVNTSFWEFRIWGWIPINGLPQGFNRDKFLNNLKKAIEGRGEITVPWNNILGKNTKNHQLKVWREYSSSRDTIIKDENDIEKFIPSLLKNEGGSQ